MQGNAVNMERLGQVMEQGKTDQSVFKIHKTVQGEWKFDPASPAFTTEVTHGSKSTTLNVDIAPGFGGNGEAPDPLQYLLTGLAACYAATVVTVATMEGAEIKSLSSKAEIELDVASVYNMGTQDLVQKVDVFVALESDASDETLLRWQETARIKCPFAFTILNPIALSTSVARK